MTREKKYKKTVVLFYDRQSHFFLALFTIIKIYLKWDIESQKRIELVGVQINLGTKGCLTITKRLWF